LTQPHILEALNAVLRRAEVYRVEGLPTVLLARLGQGWLLLDRDSPDAHGWGNSHVQMWYSRWRQEMEVRGLLGAQPEAAGLKRLKEAPELEGWFREG
jgi:hypothetical protein